uniref:WRKY19-like zinc finger domain-containing protein n=1 Tax=Chaetoceros debilis TaxID=122233 RepID=A0A7S3V5G2_9STRA
MSSKLSKNPSLVDELETARILQQLRESRKRSHASNILVEPLGKQVISRKRRLSSNPRFLETKRLPEANRTENRRAASDVPLSAVLGNISSLNARPIGPPPQLRILHCLKPISSTMPIEKSSFSISPTEQGVNSNRGNLNRNSTMIPFNTRQMLYRTFSNQLIDRGQFLAPTPFFTNNGYTKPTATNNNYSQVFFPLCAETGISADTTPLSTITVKSCRMGDCDEPADPRKLYCSKHSGPRRCERDGCKKGAQGRTRYCIAHGGGRRCQVLGCVKGARDGQFCALHGGGKRCQVEFCQKLAVGKGSKCTAHGGGRRCEHEQCSKSAQSRSDFCVRHGGGRKCKQDNCCRAAQGKAGMCSAHSSQYSKIQE